MGLMDFLAVPNAAMVDKAIGGGDLFLQLHHDKIPLKVRVIWQSELRPALVEWRKSLEAKK